MREWIVYSALQFMKSQECTRCLRSVNFTSMDTEHIFHILYIVIIQENYFDIYGDKNPYGFVL